MSRRARQPGIGSYALIADCHSAALVSRTASIDWCCLPRFDSGSCFGRLLGWETGGHCSILPVDGWDEVGREYEEESLVLVTSFSCAGAKARVIDCLLAGDSSVSDRHILRVIEGVAGEVELDVRVAPRFDYGAVSPWIRQEGADLHSAIGGDDALLIGGDAGLQPSGDHALTGRVAVREGDRFRLSLRFVRPETLDAHPPESPTAQELDGALDATRAWWNDWSSRGSFDGTSAAAVRRSAIVLKALSNAPTGAIAAAATTSLPETLHGSRNWDYRYSWIRDSAFAVRSLAEIGHDAEADDFRRFIHRSAAGHATDLQVVYGLGGERRMPEMEVESLAGWRRHGPVRIGNGAGGQRQHDAYGEILNLTWRWHRRGHSPGDDQWRFIADLVDHAAEQWEQPDQGLWEWRGAAQHFVHSKAMCWVAVDRGVRLADECLRQAPVRRWRRARREIREAVESQGYDDNRGVFVQWFGSRRLDASLLLLPGAGFIEYSDERMVRTVDAIREDLGDDGLVRRYLTPDGMKGREGAFLACSFWLVECLAGQGRLAEAQAAFDRATATANDLGLFSEEWDTRSRQAVGNFPQALTHYSHIVAALALSEAEAGART